MRETPLRGFLIEITMIYLTKLALIPAFVALLAVPQTGFESDYLPAANNESASAFLAENPPLTYRTAFINGKILSVYATAYNSVPEQTDDAPFITASGTYTRDGIIAANFLPFGTALKIPDIFGDKVFVVEDRMNERYGDRIDIWMETIEEAKKFGLRKVKIVIL